jgi:putative ABC transport system permease protein
MGRVLLTGRLAFRAVCRRPAEGVLLLLAITAATATLTLGLVLRGVTDDPYQSTREATAGPDVVASAGALGGPVDQPIDPAALDALADAPGVVAHGGPYPVITAEVKAHGRTGMAHAIGRDATPATVDQPALTDGTWVDDGGVVVEAAFADALDLDVGDPITLDDQPFHVTGVAVTAVTPPYPEISCFGFVCLERSGVIWLTQADALGLKPDDSACDGEPRRCPARVVYLALADPAAARQFIAEHAGNGIEPGGMMAWQDIRDETAELVRNQRRVLVIGSRLIGLLAVASVAVLVGGRMAGQTRRVGLLKAVGGTPGVVAAVLLAEYVAIALFAAAAGLATGWLIAPWLTDPSVGLVGRAGAPPLAMSTVVQVTALAVAVAVAATAVPAVRAARTSTVLALADTARPPRRTAWLIPVSVRLPVPLLLGLRVAARRPRRILLSTASIFVTVSGIVAALAVHAQPTADRVDEFGLPGSRTAQVNQALLMITITLVVLAAVNAVFITGATVIDNRHSSAVARSLGATAREVSAGLSATQLLPALAGALLGIPGGLGLLAAVDSDGTTTNPPLWELVAVVPSTLLVVAALTAIPARLGARRSVAGTLQAELV